MGFAAHVGTHWRSSTANSSVEPTFLNDRTDCDCDDSRSIVCFVRVCEDLFAGGNCRGKVAYRAHDAVLPARLIHKSCLVG